MDERIEAFLAYEQVLSNPILVISDIPQAREEAVPHCSESRRCALLGNKGQWSDL